MKRIKIILLIMLVPLLLAGREATEQNEGKCCPLFMSDEILDLDLEYDVNKLKNDRGQTRDYHPAKLTYSDSDGKRITLDVELKVRGNLRRTLLKCLVPPFKIRFNKTQTPNTLFEDQTSIKIVSHCRNKPKFYQEYTLQEYLLYRIYNLLSDLSFRVRLARFTFIDTQGKEPPNTKYAFFIESYKHMARRNGAKIVNIASIQPEQADFATSTLASVFEYMIGNTDWSIRSSHNMYLVTIGDNPNYFPVPYDFDQAGLIDAHYAYPDELLPIRSVRERLYRGFCQDEDQFNRTFAVFQEHKKEIMALFRNAPFLPGKIKKKNLKYLEEFYKIISSSKLVNRYFIDNYRGRPFPKR